MKNPDNPFYKQSPITASRRPFMAVDLFAAWMAWWTVAPFAVWSMLVPSEPERVDGDEATRQYARENGLSED